METSKFAQRLAANEQPKRDRAIKKLRKYIAAKTSKSGGFSEEELLQLWKGLHYCYWMQDKPLLQEELSAKLCGLLKAFPDAGSALSFAAAFFTIQAKEWGRLDQWRMDKYMMLIRDFLHATLEVVHRNRWEESLVGTVSAMVGEVMDAGKEDYPDGLRLHLADIYLEEIGKVGAKELNGDQINVLLDPFLQYVVNSKRDVIANKIIAKVFGPVLQSPTAGDESCEEGKEENETPILKFNYQGLQKMMFNAGRQKNILPKVRRKIYKLVKRCSDTGLEECQTSRLQGKRKRTGEEDEEPEKKKKKEEDEQSSEENDKRHTPSEMNHSLQSATLPPQKKKKKKKEEEKESSAGKEARHSMNHSTQSTTPSPQKKKKHKTKDKKGTPESTPKHVAFDLDRNSSRGLQEFVKSAASSPSPYLPSRSPSHGILKDSPSVAPPSSTSTDTPRAASHRGGKRFHKGQATSSKKHHSVLRQEQKSAMGKKKKSSRGEKSSKFDSKKKGKVVKKPKRR